MRNKKVLIFKGSESRLFLIMMVSLLCLLPAYAAPHEGAMIMPSPLSIGSDTLPIAWQDEINGGYKVVATAADMNAIPDERQAVGMLCYVISDKKTHRLIGIDQWEEVKTAAYTEKPINTAYKLESKNIYQGGPAEASWSDMLGSGTMEVLITSVGVTASSGYVIPLLITVTDGSGQTKVSFVRNSFGNTTYNGIDNFVCDLAIPEKVTGSITITVKALRGMVYNENVYLYLPHLEYVVLPL